MKKRTINLEKKKEQFSKYCHSKYSDKNFEDRREEKIAHFIERMHERFGIAMVKKDHEELIDVFVNYPAKLSRQEHASLSGNIKGHRIVYRGQEMVVLYNKAFGCFVTAMSVDMAEADPTKLVPSNIAKYNLKDEALVEYFLIKKVVDAEYDELQKAEDIRTAMLFVNVYGTYQSILRYLYLKKSEENSSH